MDYGTYLADPFARARIEREIARLRSETFRRFLLHPLIACLRAASTR